MILRIHSNDENTRPFQEVYQPIQGGFESLDGMQPPINESNVELTARETTGCCRRDAIVAAAMQLKHLVGALRTCHDDSMKLGTPGKLNHRLDDLLA
jgi:hypothetical protein